MIFAECYDGASGARRAVQLIAAPPYLDVRDKEGRLLYQPEIAHIRVLREPKHGQSGVLGLRHARGVRVYVDDKAFLALEGILPRRLFPEHSPAGALWRYAKMAAAGAAVVFLLLYAGGAAVASVAESVPASWRTAFGSFLFHMHLKQHPACADEAGAQALQALTAKLVDAAGGTLTPTVKIVRDEEPNAFAFPGGFIAVNSGLAPFAETPEAFAAVLAHEIAHIEALHPEQGAARGIAGAVVSALAGGGDAGAFFAVLIDRKYGRDAERGADMRAQEILSAAGVHRGGAAAFFDKLRRTYPGEEAPPLLATHPGSESRSISFAAAAREDDRRSLIPPLSKAQWNAVIAACE